MRLELACGGHRIEHLSAVADAHDRVETLIRDVLQSARVGEEVGKVEPVSLATVVADAMINTSLGASRLTAEADARLFVDRGRLTAVFKSLFRNAVEHGSANRRESPNETVSRGVSTETLSPAADKNAVDASGHRARAGTGGGTPSINVRVDPLENGLFVEGDGPGALPEEQDRTFKSRYNTNSQGTGLGLAITAGVANTRG